MSARRFQDWKVALVLALGILLPSGGFTQAGESQVPATAPPHPLGAPPPKPIILQSDGSQPLTPPENQAAILGPSFPPSGTNGAEPTTVILVRPEVSVVPQETNLPIFRENGAWSALDRADQELIYRRTLDKMDDDGAIIAIDPFAVSPRARPGENGADLELRRAQGMYIRGKVLTDQVDREIYVIDP